MKYIFAVLLFASFIPLAQTKDLATSSSKNSSNTNISITIMEQPLEEAKRPKEWGVRTVKTPRHKHPKILGMFRVPFNTVEQNTQTFEFSTPTQIEKGNIPVATTNKTLDGSLFLFVQNGNLMGKISTNISQLHSTKTAVVKDNTVALPNTKTITFGGAIQEGEQYFDLDGVRYYVYLENLSPTPKR